MNIQGHSKRKPLKRKGWTPSSEKVLVQKMLECVEVQVKVLKKIISHLSKREEEDLKEEEEDEEDKVDYGQSELAQENIDRMMTERKVCLLPPKFMPQLKSTPGP